MKNTTHILKALLLSILTSLFFSCNNSLIFTNTSSVGFTVSPEVFKAVRAADDSAQAISMEVTLTKNGTNEDIISKDYDDIPQDTESFVFNNIPVGTKVQATVKITNGDVVLEGTSEEKVVSLGKVILQIKLARSDVEGKKLPADGSLVIEEASIIINLLDSAECYNNTKSLSFSVTDDEDNAVTATNWTATLCYGGRKVDGTSITDGKFSFGSDHIRSGDYQLYVTAEYEGVTASSTFDLNVLDLAKFEMDVGAYTTDDLLTALKELVNRLWSDALFVLTGNGTAETIQAAFQSTYYQDTDIPYSVTIDMSAVKGITTLGSDSIALNDDTSTNSCLTKFILPDSLTTIEDCAISCEKYVDADVTLSIGSNLASISYPFYASDPNNNSFKNPFVKFELSSDNKYFKTNDSGTLLINKAGDTIVWGANAYDLVIPNSVKTIGKGAFYGCTRIEYHEADYSTAAISMNKVEIIYENAFSGTQSSQGYALTESVQAVGANAFDSSAPVSDDDVSADQKWNWHYTTDRDTWLNNDSTGVWTDLTENTTGYFRSAVSNGNYLRRK